MSFRPRTLLVGGVALLVLAAVLYGTLRLTYGERAAFVHVRWAPDVDDARRQEVERAHALRPVEFREQRTWTYFLTDLSTENIRSLVTSPAVEDTHHIDRRAFRIASTSERGEYSTTRPAWIADLMEFLIDASLLAGAVAIVAGAYSTWRERGAGTTPSAAA